jgi:hypothetical protein
MNPINEQQATKILSPKPSPHRLIVEESVHNDDNSIVCINPVLLLCIYTEVAMNIFYNLLYSCFNILLKFYLTFLNRINCKN